MLRRGGVRGKNAVKIVSVKSSGKKMLAADRGTNTAQKLQKPIKHTLEHKVGLLRYLQMQMSADTSSG